MGIGYKEDFQALAVCTVFLFLKMWAVALYTGRGRGAEGKPAAPEDAFNKKKEATANYGTIDQQPNGMSQVERGQAMHRNDLENIPIFLITAILLLVSGPFTHHHSYVAHVIYYAIFTFARLGHSVSYMFGLQPWRSICYGVGMAANFAAAIHLLVQVFSWGAVVPL